MRLLHICFLTIFAIFSIPVKAQKLPVKVAAFVKDLSLFPLSNGDTVPENVSNYFSEKSDWRYCFYTNPYTDDQKQLFAYEIIYNDSVFHTLSILRNPLEISKNSMSFVRETSEYLYLKILNPAIGDNLYIFSKKEDNVNVLFTDLISKDFENNIFIVMGPNYSNKSKIPFLQISNINTRKTEYIMFKGICEDTVKNKWCIVNVSYSNGRMAITAKLRKKRSKKEYQEIHYIEI